MRLSVDLIVPSARGTRAAEAAVRSARAAAPNVQLEVRVVEDPDRRGPGWARNRAVQGGEAEFLALLDDDDRWLPGRLDEALVILAERPLVALVCGDAVLPSGGLFLSPTRGGRRNAVAPGDHDHAALVADCFVCTSTVTMRRVDWENAGGMPEDLRNAEDYALWLRLTAGGRAVHVLPDSLARYGVGDRAQALDTDRPAALAGAREALRREARVPVPATRFGLKAALREWWS
jgi:glycosyltransferase involved in cell wall biosynthesis